MNIKIGSVSLINNSYDAVVLGFPIEEIFLEKININENRTAFNSSGIYRIKKNSNILSDNINYMIVSLSGENEYIRYYFITNINEINGILELNYEIDIFSTYFNKCNILNARIERSSVLNFLDHNIISYKRPVKLTGVKTSSYTSPLFNVTYSKTDVYIILKTQITLNTEPIFSSGEVNYRCFVISKIFSSLYEIQTFLTDIISGQRDRKIQYIDPGTQAIIEQYFYQIGDIYVVPKCYINTQFGSSSLYLITGNGRVNLYTYTGDQPMNIVNTTELSQTRGLEVIGYGTFDNIKEYDGFAGGSYEIWQMTYLSAIDFSIYLLDKDGLMDITRSFQVDIPMTTMDGETFAQIKTEKALQMIGGLLQIGGSIANMAVTGGILGEMAGVGSGLLGPISSVPRIATGPNASSIMGGAILSEHNFTRNLISSEISSAGGVLGGIKNIIQANEPFVSSKVNKTASSAFVNLEYGICIVRMRGDAIERQRIFKDNIGYIVDEIMGEDLKYPNETLPVDHIYYGLRTGNYSYYYIKASYVQLIGEVPADIKINLCRILQNGVRIYMSYSEIE